MSEGSHGLFLHAYIYIHIIHIYQYICTIDFMYSVYLFVPCECRALFTCLSLYTRVLLVNEGCGGLFLVGDELHHACIPHLF